MLVALVSRLMFARYLLASICALSLSHVKGHRGISVNEEVDALAGQGLKRQLDSGIAPVRQIGHRDIKAALKAVAERIF